MREPVEEPLNDEAAERVSDDVAVWVTLSVREPVAVGVPVLLSDAAPERLPLMVALLVSVPVKLPVLIGVTVEDVVACSSRGRALTGSDEALATQTAKTHARIEPMRLISAWGVDSEAQRRYLAI